MMRKILLALALLGFASPALATTCAVSALQVKDNAATTANVPYSDSGDSSGNCVPGVKVLNTNANGSATGANSSPVVSPSDYVSGKAISSLVKGTTASMTGTSSTQLLAAVSAKVIYVMNVDCVNSSATATLVTLQDGSGGTALGTVAAAASGGGHAVHATFPVTWTTSGNGLYVANVTTSAAVICTASGFAQ
jgi:hypothetical protein